MDRLRFFCFLLTLLIVGFLSTGCVANIGPGGAAPGLIYSDVTYPNILNPGMEYRLNFDREDIEILGPVESRSYSRWYFFLVSIGDSGYSELMERAREQGGDGVMNVTIDTEYNSFLIVYAKVTTKLTGLAYRYRRLADEPETPEIQ
jgi:hypothetical protein